MTNNAFYLNTYQQFGYSVKSLGWGSTESQEKRFKALSEVGIDNGDRVLDVGCGFGDLYFYLKKNGCDTDYTGLDVNKNFISLNKSNHPNLDFRHGEISEIDKDYDWVVASGIFCFKSENWFHETLTVVQDMLSKSIKGVAFNCLFNKGRREKINNQSYYLNRSDAGKLVGYLSDNSSKVTINANYLPNDISFFIYKL